MGKETVQLLQEHEHAGLVHPVGAKLELDADQAQRLIEAGRARSAAIEHQRKTKSKQED